MAQNKFNITAFTSEIDTRGVASPAYFMVMIKLPNRAIIEESLSLRIEQASLPTRSILTHEQRYYGPMRRIPYSYNSQELALTVMLSENMREREIFMNWQDLMVGRSRIGHNNRKPLDAPFDVGYYDTAVKGAVIEIMTYATSPAMQGNDSSLVGELKGIAEAVGFDTSKITNPFGFDLFKLSTDRKINHAYKVTLIEPFPISINEVPLSWADDGHARLQVQISYRYFLEEHINYEKNARQDTSIGSMVRGGINMFNKFKPALSLIRGQGLSGAVQATGSQFGSGMMSNIKSMTKF